VLSEERQLGKNEGEALGEHLTEPDYFERQVQSEEKMTRAQGWGPRRYKS
jgi:hypothetical protein